MSCLPKLYAIILNSLLNSRATKAQLRATFQAGFRPNYRTEDNCLLLKMIFEYANFYKGPLFAQFVDLKKAYDSVERDRLWKILID